MTVVVDASALVAALVDDGPDGRWARGTLRDDDVAAPGHLQVEVSNVLRRLSLAGTVAAETAAQAHADLSILPVTVFAFAPLAARIWELRSTITAYDAAYVALAEALGVSLLTLDLRLSRSSGPRCEIRVPRGELTAG